MSKKFYKKNLEWLLLIFPIAIIVKIAQQIILPDKYFYDSQKILMIMNGSISADKSYLVTADLFNFINIFKFDSLIEWSILLAFIFNIIVFYILLTRHKKYTFTQYVFIYASIVLLNIYVFNLSKDIIQFIVFFIISNIIVNRKMSNFSKIITIALIMVIEALTYRIYYGIMAMILFSIYGIYLVFIKNKVVNKKNILKIIIISILLFFLELFIISLVSQNSYNSIVNARNSVNQYREDGTDANTMITEILGENTNFVKFVGNYIINFFRMMFPIELLFKGIKYIPFILYQIYISYIFLKNAKKISTNNIVILATYLSFFMVSAIFEPDFGSFIRHETTAILIIIEMANYKDEVKEEKNEKYEFKKTSEYYCTNI